MIDLMHYKKALENLPQGIKEAEVNAEKTERTVLRIKDSKLAGSEASSRTKLFVRATGERTGLTYTEKLDDNPYEVLNKAFENSKYSLSETPEVMGAAGLCELKKGGAKESVEDAVAFGIEIEKYALANTSVDRVTECTVSLCTREVKTINSKGLDSSYVCNWTECTIGLTLKRSVGNAPGYAYKSADSICNMNASDIAQEAILDGTSYDGGGLTPCAVKSGKYDAVLSGRVMRNIIMTAWRALSGNAMQSGETIFSHEVETVTGSKSLNIVNAPSHSMLGQAWLTDSEGTVIKNTKIVKNGVLMTPLYTLESGKAAGMPSTGSAGRIDRMTGTLPIKLTTVPAVFYVEPGEMDVKGLVQKMGTGFLLTYSLDLFHSVNPSSGEFSIPCGGVYYENGTPLGSVSQMTIAGNIKELFMGIQEVGNDIGFDDFYLKSYTIGSPSALICGLDFSS